MQVVRWVFQDMSSGETHTVELNPNEMTSYIFGKEFDFGRHDGARARTIMRSRQPKQINFGGVVRTESHHDSLIHWQKKPGKVRVTDHLGRTFELMIRALDMTDRRPTGLTTWRFQYQFDCLLLRRVA